MKREHVDTLQQIVGTEIAAAMIALVTECEAQALDSLRQAEGNEIYRLQGEARLAVKLVKFLLGRRTRTNKEEDGAYAP